MDKKVGTFSKRSTNKAVLTETLQHPLTLLGTATGVLGGVAAALFGGGVLLSSIAVGGVSLGLLSWVINYYGRRGVFADRHLRELRRKLDEQRDKTFASLQKDLADLAAENIAPQYSDQGRRQFELAEKRYNNFERLLSQKIAPHEITFGRYLGTAEQVYLSILDNLIEIVHTLRSISTIDVSYIEQRQTALEALADLAQADQKELQTLRKRLEIRQKKLVLVNELLTRNEEAMTALDHVAASVAEMKVGGDMSRIGLESAMAQLEDLAGRVGRYGN